MAEQSLELWVAPQAGKDNDYWIRNFSNRDDHTKIYDKIFFRDLPAGDFLGCDYDPFHSVLKFKNQSLHIATVFDAPLVYIWFEKDGNIEFKSDKADTRFQKEDQTFVVHHPDRGLNLDYVAMIADEGAGGYFKHQLQIDKGRSTYAKAMLKAGTPLVIAAELQKKNVLAIAQKGLEKPVEEVLAATQKEIDDLSRFGKVIFKDLPDQQKLIDFNKRIWLSAQDHSGAMQAALKAIYYLLWVRDGGLATTWLAYSGWTNPLATWVDFALANPTEIHDEGPGGRFFGQMSNKKITKWQEDGLFYITWGAFTHWTQTNDDQYIKGDHLALIREATDWLERYCYDEQKGLF